MFPASNAVNKQYVHEYPDWPKLHWDDKKLSALLASVRHAQGRLLGRMEGLESRSRTEATLRTLTSDVIKSSAIEGERLDEEEVRSSIARQLRLKIKSPKPKGRDVDGVVSMMLDATQHSTERLTGRRLFAWHTSLFAVEKGKGSALAIGKWRPVAIGAMRVVSGRVGKERVHFVAPAADRIPHEMTEFLDWFEAPAAIDPVLKAGVAHLWFLTIHPFEDGNGRIGRAIADMALARADGTPDRFYSMSARIEAERKDYYLTLERSQRGTTDITDWLEWFLACLGRAIAGAEDALAGTIRKARLWERINEFCVNDRQRKVINCLLDGFEGKLSTSKYAALAKCSDDTALRDIKQLVARGILIQDGPGGRSTRYRLAVEKDTALPPI